MPLYTAQSTHKLFAAFSQASMIHIKEKWFFHFGRTPIRKPRMSRKPWPLTLKAITFFSLDSLHFNASSMAQQTE
jgi:hypothetical protein